MKSWSLKRKKLKQKIGETMSEAVQVAFISGGITLAGTILTIIFSARKTNQAMETKIAVTETKLDNLTVEVRRHNGYGERIPKLEGQVDALTDRMKQLENNLK